jgi:hypothetical protein
MVFVEDDEYRQLRRPGDDPARFRSPVRLSVVPDIAVTDGLIAWYRFADSSNTATDYTAVFGVGSNTTSLDGNVNGATSTPNGGVRDVVSGDNPSGAYDFDGADDIITTPVDNLSTPLTFMAWINPNSLSGNQGIFSQFNFGSKDWFLRLEGANVQFKEDQRTTSVDTGADVTTGTFDHLTLILGDSENELLVNGSSVFSDAVNSPVSFPAALSIGALASGTNHLDAVIDDVRAYDRAVSVPEINQVVSNTDPN